MTLATRPKRPTHTKKMQGAHHRHSKDYLKTYWPYIPMLMTVVIGLAINSLWTSNGHVLGDSSDFSSTSLLTDTNAQRAADHEAALTLDQQLTTAAQTKANDMVAHNYWSHTSPTGQTPWSFITTAGYSYVVAGENLAYGFSNASDTVTGWMSSPEHRANILDAAYQNVGFGVASSSDYLGQGPTTIVVAEYASREPAVANITFSVPNSTPSGTLSSTSSEPTELSAQPVSRVQLLTGGQAAWSALTLSALAGASLAVIIIRHARYWHCIFARSEAYLAHHPFLDITLTAVAVLGFVLTRSSGSIR
jgi:uncharacterized protein YkwD